MIANRIARALPALVVLTGCFQYRAAAPGAIVPAGQSVRLELTDVGRVAVAPMAGEGVDQIDGIVDSFADTVVLRVTSVRRRDMSEPWTRERLRVASNDVRSVSVKRFSSLRTAALVGGLVVAAATVRLGSSDSFFGGGRSRGGSNTGR